jgi:hypothetical protein
MHQANSHATAFEHLVAASQARPNILGAFHIFLAGQG